MLYEGFHLAALQESHCPSCLVGFFMSKTDSELQVEEVSSDSPFLTPALLGKPRQFSFFHIFQCKWHFLWIQHRHLFLSPSSFTRWSRHPERLHHCFVKGHLSFIIMCWLYCKQALPSHYQLPLIYHQIYYRSIVGSDLCFHLLLCLKETSTGYIYHLSWYLTERHFFAALYPEFSFKQSKSPLPHRETWQLTLSNKILTLLTAVYATEMVLFYTELVLLTRDKKRKKSQKRNSPSHYHPTAFLIKQSLNNTNTSK